MKDADMKLMDEVVKAVHSLHRGRPIAKSKEQAEEWRHNDILYWREKVKHLQPLSHDLLHKVQDALVVWNQAESKYLDAVKTTREQIFAALHSFHDLIERATRAIDVDRETPKCLWDIGFFLDVPKIEWIDAFLWELPQAYPSDAYMYREVAKMMVVTLYMRFIRGKDYNFPLDLKAYPDLSHVEWRYIYAFDKGWPVAK